MCSPVSIGCASGGSVHRLSRPSRTAPVAIRIEAHAMGARGRDKQRQIKSESAEDIVGNRLYVGNLPYTVTDDQLREAFAPHGEVTSASVVMDRATGRSRGFGFVEMSTPEQATKATEQMNGALLEGRPLTVNEARERAPRTGGPRPFNGGGDRGGFRSDGDRGGFRGGA